MSYGIVGSVVGGLFFVGVWKLGRWSVRNKVVELENMKLQLILSKDNHQEIIDEIDNKIKEIQDYNKLSIFDKVEKSE